MELPTRFLPRPKIPYIGYGLISSPTLKESPIYHQNVFELRTTGMILMGDLGEWKEVDGRSVFDEFIDGFDQLINKHHDHKEIIFWIISNLKAGNSNCTHSEANAGG